MRRGNNRETGGVFINTVDFITFYFYSTPWYYDVLYLSRAFKKEREREWKRMIAQWLKR